MDQRIVFVVSVLETSVSKRLEVETLAASVNLSSSRLRHLFKAEMGLTIIQYQKDARIERGRELLLTTFLSVKEIVNEVGFADHSNFIREFKKAHGISPSMYRSLGPMTRHLVPHGPLANLAKE